MHEIKKPFFHLTADGSTGSSPQRPARVYLLLAAAATPAIISAISVIMTTTTSRRSRQPTVPVRIPVRVPFAVGGRTGVRSMIGVHARCTFRVSTVDKSTCQGQGRGTVNVRVLRRAATYGRLSV
jgi:hypothetical protein